MPMHATHHVHAGDTICGVFCFWFGTLLGEGPASACETCPGWCKRRTSYLAVQGSCHVGEETPEETIVLKFEVVGVADKPCLNPVEPIQLKKRETRELEEKVCLM